MAEISTLLKGYSAKQKGVFFPLISCKCYINSSIGGHLHTLLPNHTEKPFIDNNSGECIYKLVGLCLLLLQKQPGSRPVNVEVIKKRGVP